MKTLGLSSRARLLKASPTLSITAKAKSMKAQGVDVISLAAGEPDFNTPEAVCQAAIDALHAGKTKYTATSGMPELKEAIAEKLRRENGIAVRPEQVVVSCGAKQSLYNAVMTLVEPGDEVLLIAPYWMTYAEQIVLAGASPVVVRALAENGFVPLIEDLKAAVTERTRAIIINSPCNPTGAVFPRQTLKDIAMLAMRHGLWVIADEIYERLVYGQAHQSIASLGSDIAEQTVTISGVSKTYAMTGWRIGYSAAPDELASAFSNLQDQVTSSPTSFAQAGAIQALCLESSEIEKMRTEFQERRDLVVGLLRAIPGIEVTKPEGAFYVLPSINNYLGGRIQTDGELAAYLLENAQTAVIPGEVFEAQGHLRISYAASRDDIRRGIGRIAEALGKIGI
ncbi:MAG: pyridoxal phosphate-dependent aminotransferase [Fimbriimonadaceae bacterium]